MTSEQVREMVKHYGKDTTLELLRQRINELEATQMKPTDRAYYHPGCP